MNCQFDPCQQRCALENLETCIHRNPYACCCEPACPCQPALCVPGPAVCDLPPYASMYEVVCTVNKLLASLRSTGVIASCDCDCNYPA